MKLLLYCTKAKPMLRVAKEEMKCQKRARCYSKEETKYFTQYIGEEMYEANGKIVAECDFEVEKIIPINCTEDDYDYGLFSGKDLLKESCLGTDDICEYLNDYDGETIFKKGYAIHIKNLHIFDKPKELSDYFTEKSYNDINKIFTDEIMIDRKWYRPVNKAPQNMMKVKRVLQEDGILISIRPEWLCKILNGEKTIEVRKKVLEEMLSND
jgi:predicted transcriptional regulator